MCIDAKITDFLKPDYSTKVESVFMVSTLAVLKADENLDALWVCYADYEYGE